MANLRCSAAEESEDTLNAFTSPTFREPNREADNLANLETEGKWKITTEGVENMETRKTLRGYWDGSTEEDGCSGCGIVIKPVSRENWITISNTAVPLKTSTAMTTEIAGACV